MRRRERRRSRSRKHRLQDRVRTALTQGIHYVANEMAFHNVPRTKVNYGWCDPVAEFAQERLWKMGITALIVRDDDELRTTTHDVYGDTPYTHTWIWVEGRHYDAESLGGVRRWLELPHFQRWLEHCPDLGDVDIDPVFTHGDEQQLFFQTARWLREAKGPDGPLWSWVMQQGTREGSQIRPPALLAPTLPCSGCKRRPSSNPAGTPGFSRSSFSELPRDLRITVERARSESNRRALRKAVKAASKYFKGVPKHS